MKEETVQRERSNFRKRALLDGSKGAKTSQKPISRQKKKDHLAEQSGKKKKSTHKWDGF
ncbi:hypothetical protein [Succinimonas amylolytica]|uniref:hypothetical protein n=1 Tax=Succinimonas amylolytica TaxID=83769 RepID=UPI0012F9686E|nr:hypothetical protein [Succinimonas amylolytica]